MLLSTKHKFIFIHVHKVAGSSITRSLIPYTYNSTQKVFNALANRMECNLLETKGATRRNHPHKFLTYYDRPRLSTGLFLLNNIIASAKLNYQILPVHSTVTDLEHFLPTITFSSFFKFAFVRNPWDWLASLYFYMKSNKAHPNHFYVNQLQSFSNFIEWQISTSAPQQADFICDSAGKIKVDYVGRFESLEHDFKSVCNRLGIQTALPRINSTPHTHYAELYNRQMQQRVSTYFAKDIELFKYRF